MYNNSDRNIMCWCYTLSHTTVPTVSTVSVAAILVLPLTTCMSVVSIP